MLSLALTAAPFVSVVYAAPDNESPAAADRRRKENPKPVRASNRPHSPTAYRAAYAAIYDRHDYVSAITQLRRSAVTTLPPSPT